MSLIGRLVADARTAVRVVRNALRSRRLRNTAKAAALVDSTRDLTGLRIGVYFADTRVNLYQMRQWYGPLAELAATHPVVIIARSPGSYLTLRDEAPVPVVYLRGVTDIERFLETQELRLVLYVNQNQKNFQMFRYGRMWHVFVNHGESDKMYMTSNQFKAYDYALVAGDAALDRLSRKLWAYDVAAKAIPIGRPQADHFAGVAPYPPDDRVTVLYAPTWEGDRPAAAYGSIASHGRALAGAVLDSSRHRLIYRPHPRSGVLSPDYRQAHLEIVAAIEAANAKDPSAHHVYDDKPLLGWQLAAADVAITDISAMIYDRLATGKPILVARPVSPDAEVDEEGFLGAVDWVLAEQASGILGLVDRALTDPAAVAKLVEWSTRYFGDTTPGAATARFHAAIERLSAEWETHAALHAGDRRVSESDPLDDEDEEGMPAAE